MKNKKDIWMITIAVVSILFIAALYFAARNTEPVAADKTEKDPVQDTQMIQQSEEVLETEEADESKTFTAADFAKQFSKTLPNGYSFSEEIKVNPNRENRMQVDVLDETETSTDIAIIFDAEDENQSCDLMALTIKQECFADDADAILKWYLFTFLENYTEEMKKAIYDDYLYIFDTGAEDYRVYSEEGLTVMMSCETEGTDKYYYVMLFYE